MFSKDAKRSMECDPAKPLKCQNLRGANYLPNGVVGDAGERVGPFAGRVADALRANLDVVFVDHKEQFS